MNSVITPAFVDAVTGIPRGYSQGRFDGRSYGVTVVESDNGQRLRFYADELGGNDVVSFNLYRSSEGTYRLKPCEMSADKIARFVLAYTPTE